MLLAAACVAVLLPWIEAGRAAQAALDALLRNDHAADPSPASSGAVTGDRSTLNGLLDVVVTATLMPVDAPTPQTTSRNGAGDDARHAGHGRCWRRSEDKGGAVCAEPAVSDLGLCGDHRHELRVQSPESAP